MNTDTPLTDREQKHWISGSDGMMAVRVEFAQELERKLATIVGENLLAIDILDGNADRIDWRDRSQPELLRKLCEHLDANEH